MDEKYSMPWSSVDIPHALQTLIFPFVEEVLVSLKSGPSINHGTIGFLELLQCLRPFFWRLCMIPFSHQWCCAELVYQGVASIQHAFSDSTTRRLEVM